VLAALVLFSVSGSADGTSTATRPPTASFDSRSRRNATAMSTVMAGEIDTMGKIR